MVTFAAVAAGADGALDVEDVEDVDGPAVVDDEEVEAGAGAAADDDDTTAGPPEVCPPHAELDSTPMTTARPTTAVRVTLRVGRYGVMMAPRSGLLRRCG